MTTTSQAHGFLITKAKHFVFYNFLSVFVFGIIYYILQYFDGKTFVSNRAIADQHAHLTNRFSLIECIHFSLVTQTTIGYGGMIPLSKACVLVNSIQLMILFLITATSIGK